MSSRPWRCSSSLYFSKLLDSWPSNVRELENISTACITATGDFIDLSDLAVGRTSLYRYLKRDGYEGQPRAHSTGAAA